MHDLSLFKRMLTDTMVQPPVMRPSVADIKREIVARINAKAGEYEAAATAEQRREMARWFAGAVEQMRRPVVMPVIKRLSQ